MPRVHTPPVPPVDAGSPPLRRPFRVSTPKHGPAAPGPSWEIS